MKPSMRYLQQWHLNLHHKHCNKKHCQFFSIHNHKDHSIPIYTSNSYLIKIKIELYTNEQTWDLQFMNIDEGAGTPIKPTTTASIISSKRFFLFCLLWKLWNTYFQLTILHLSHQLFKKTMTRIASSWLGWKTGHAILHLYAYL